MAPVFAAMAAQMRAMARGTAEGGPSPVLHALILFALARIIDRLHAMVLDWQQGRLTLPPCSLPPNLPPGRAWAALSRARIYRPHTRTPPLSRPAASSPGACPLRPLPMPAMRPAIPAHRGGAPRIGIARRRGNPSPERAMRPAAGAPRPFRFQNPVDAVALARVLNVTKKEHYQSGR
jgi:hypothetical protein